MIHDHSEKLETGRFIAANDIDSCGHWAAQFGPTGSAYFGKEDPSDFDSLILVRKVATEGALHGVLLEIPDTLDDLIEKMEALGWELCGEDGECSGGNADSEDYRATWCAMRKGEFNAIITTDDVWYLRQAAATALVRQLSLDKGEALSKEQVIYYFRMIREGSGGLTEGEQV